MAYMVYYYSFLQNSWAWSLLGHTHFLLEDFSSAREAYERCLLLVTPPPSLHSVYLHLAHIHLSEKRVSEVIPAGYHRVNDCYSWPFWSLQYSKAKDVYLRACRNAPSGVSWRGVGVACYQVNHTHISHTKSSPTPHQMGDLAEAEAALSEANVLNNHDPITWAYLVLVCLKVTNGTYLDQETLQDNTVEPL